MKVGTLVKFSAKGKKRWLRSELPGTSEEQWLSQVGVVMHVFGQSPWYYVEWYPSMKVTGQPRYQLKYARQS